MQKEGHTWNNIVKPPVVLKEAEVVALLTTEWVIPTLLAPPQETRAATSLPENDVAKMIELVDATPKKKPKRKNQGKIPSCCNSGRSRLGH
jgi:hypothetical protein